MKSITIALVLATVTTTCTAFNNQVSSSSSRREHLQNIATRISTATTAALVVVGGVPHPSFAKDTLSTTPYAYINGVYSDPNHKSGYRIVRTIDKSNNILVTLQDDMDGPVITIPGKINPPSSTTKTINKASIILDLSKKGGPKNVVATSKDASHILFPDGNTWTKLGGVNGIYYDPNHPTGYRIVRITNGGKVYVTLQDTPKGDVIDVEGMKKVGSGYITIDFSPKGGPKDIMALVKVDKLVFADGNTWTKL
jgi:hypothetical protein